MQFLKLAALVLAINIPVLCAENDQERVDRIFAGFVKAGSPGCSLGVIRDGAFLYRKSYGEGSLELGVPLSSQSVFYMGSVSKQFTAASVVLAAEQGSLSLDDDVRKYIPELPDYGHPITLRQMLHHTSGLRDFLGLLGLAGRHGENLHTSEEMLDLIVHQKSLNYVPGDEYLYSNTNYFLLGEVIKRATGKTLAAFAAGNIFQPLGMVHTRFYDDHTLVLPGRVAAYSPGSHGDFAVDWSTNFDTVGAGGLMSTVDDLLLWDKNFYDNKLGKGTLLKEMLTRGVLNNGKQIDYALGLEIGKYRGLPTVEHDGALFGYRTEILRFPEQHFSVVCLCNLSTSRPSGLAHKVADIYLEKNLEPLTGASKPATTGAVSDADRFSGRYEDMRDHSIVSFISKDGALSGFGSVLQNVGPGRFETPGGAAIAFEDSNGAMNATITYGGQTITQAIRLQDFHPEATALAACAGNYASEELGVTYRVSTSNGSLMLRIGWDTPMKLDPIRQDEWANDDLGTLVFQRDAQNRISGFALFAGRVRNIAFVKAQ